MAQQIQEPQETVSQLGKRRRISARTWRYLLLIAAIIIIVIFVLASLGDFPTIMGMTPLVFAAILSGCVGILSLLVGIIPLIHDDVEPNANTSSSTGSSYSFSGPVNFYQSSPSPQPSATAIPEPAKTPPDTPSTRTATEPSVRRPSGSLSFHRATINALTNPRTIQQREKTVKEVYDALTRPDISSIVLTGMGGQGKSTLAALVFKYVEEQRLSSPQSYFQAETLWFSMRYYLNFQGLAEDILQVLQKPIPKFGELPPINQALALMNALTTEEKPRLIIIDQFENLLDQQTGKALADRPGVGEFLDALNSIACTSRVLLTSRPRPRGTQPQLANLRPFPVDGLSSEEGIDLFRKQGVSDTQATDAMIAKAVRHCKGHALALTLLATLLIKDQSLTVDSVLAQDKYRNEWGDDIAKELLDVIYREHLDETQRQLLLAFSIYQEPVPMEAVEAIFENANTNLSSARHVLLTEHLLQAAGNNLYQLHTTVADYAHTHFVAGDRQANETALHLAHEKAAQYYMQLGEATCPERNKRRKLEDVQPFVEAVRHYCDAEQWQEVYTLLVGENLFNDLSLWGENVLLLELCLPFSNNRWQTEPRQKALICSYLGFVYDDLGDKQQALDYYEQALTLMRAVGDRGGEGVTLNNLGRVYDALGDKQKALDYYEQALTLRRAVGDKYGEATTLHNIGMIYLVERHGLEVGIACILPAKKLFEKVQSPSDVEDEVQVLNSLGQMLGDKQFAQLVAQVEPRAQQIVDEALSKL